MIMKIWVDTSIVEEVEQVYAIGIADGVTTNPTNMKMAVDQFKEKGQNIELEKYITRILTIAKGTPVSLEVIGTTYDEMLFDAEMLFNKFNRIAHNVYIKIPFNTAGEFGSPKAGDGLKVLRELAKKKIPTNCTLVFTPEQCLLAAKAGATVISPFAGRIDDKLRKSMGIPFSRGDYYPAEGMIKDRQLVQDNGILSGVDLVQKCVEVGKKYNLKSEIVASSIRNPRQLREVAFAGSHIATCPFRVIMESLEHIKTVEGVQDFTKDVVPEYRELIRGKDK